LLRNGWCALLRSGQRNAFMETDMGQFLISVFPHPLS
jgi:hypothetical protein